ncbi:MAG: type II toxin-antitoxin system death-on-curing family toxin [Proteobacteria bacterium]|nr:type II toxin-antitoxin system death-on-curing family toxin [Pseudomonadota bacterium]
MNEPKWILVETAISIHQIILAEHGGSTGIRDMSLLESALARPKQRYVYQPESTLFELAASYSFGLAKNHPFVDGNKRTSLTVGILFLELNGLSFHAPEPEAVIAFENLASGLISELGLSDWFRLHSVS